MANDVLFFPSGHFHQRREFLDGHLENHQIVPVFTLIFSSYILATDRCMCVTPAMFDQLTHGVLGLAPRHKSQLLQVSSIAAGCRAVLLLESRCIWRGR